LAADFPARPEFRWELARSHNNLGLLLQNTGRLKEAEAAYRDALGLQKQLAADFPTVADYCNDLANSLVHVANLLRGRQEFASARQLLQEAVLHHQAALQANPRHPHYRQSYHSNLLNLVPTLAGLGDQASAVQTATKLRDLGWDPAGEAYDAACALALCVPAVEKNTQLAPEQRRQQSQFYAEQAVAMLRDAIDKGWKDVAHMKKDTDLDPLRDREDFKQLLAQLEAKSAQAPPKSR
jgi:tetratricopeptide (TPR) repeat protein